MGGSKGGSAGKAYDYFGSIAAVVCAGPVDYLASVIVDGKEIWPGAAPWKAGVPILLHENRTWGGRTWFAKSAHTSSGANAPPNATFWGTFYAARGANIFSDIDINGYGRFRIYWGTTSQVQEPLLSAAGNEWAQDHPDYKGICYVVLKGFLFGRERRSAPNVEVIVWREPQQSVITGNGNMDAQANLAVASCELLTSANGLGLATSGLDATSFQTTANDLQTNNKVANCSPLIEKQDPVRSIFAEFALITDAFLRFNPATAKIEAGRFLHGQVPASYTTLTTADLADRPSFEGEGWDTTKTRAVITYTSRARGYKQTSEKHDDPRAYKVLQEHRTLQLERNHIVRQEQALKHAAQTLRVVGRPQLSGDVPVRREKGRLIRPGDYVLLDIDLEPDGVQLNQFFRVVEREIPFKGPIRFKLDADETLAAEYYQPEETGEADIEEAVDAVANLRVIEAPVSLSDFEPDHVIILAERPTEKITGFQVWFDTATAGTFQIIGDSRGWATRCVLRSDVTNAATSVPISMPAQVDHERPASTTNDLNAANDTLLAFLVEKDGSAIKADADEYQWVEAASISLITIVAAPAWASGQNYLVGQVRSDAGLNYTCILNHLSDGTNRPPNATYWLQGGNHYDLTAIRGRQQTASRAFTAANCEVWIIPRAKLDAFHHKKFPDLRTNRIEGATPDTAYFRVGPYTDDNSRELADCTSVSFQFAKSSPAGPSLALTAPTATAPHKYPVDWALNLQWSTDGSSGPSRCWHGGTGYRCIVSHTSSIPAWEPGVGADWTTYWVAEAPSYPYEFDIEGTWTDPNADMTAFEILTKKDGSTTEVIEEEDAFAPVGTFTFDETIHIAESGTWRVRLQGTDATGLITKRTVTVEARGSNTQVAKPKFRYHHGKKLKGTEWNVIGKIALRCRTEDANIRFQNRVAEDRDWKSGDIYVIGDHRWHNDVIYVCWAGHTAAATSEPGVGATWNNFWKSITAQAGTLWASGVNYVVGDLRRIDTNGFVVGSAVIPYSFMCIANHLSSSVNKPREGTGNWRANWVYAEPDGTLDASVWLVYVADNEGFSTQPYGWLPKDDIRQILWAKAWKVGYIDSAINVLTNRFKRIDNDDRAPS